MVVVEAMASGIPVIAKNAGGVPEIIQHGRNGMLVPPGDVGALADSIRLLAGNARLRERLGRQARQDTTERYEYRKQTDTFFNFCRSVYAERQKRLGKS